MVLSPTPSMFGGIRIVPEATATDLPVVIDSDDNVQLLEERPSLEEPELSAKCRSLKDLQTLTESMFEEVNMTMRRHQMDLRKVIDRHKATIASLSASASFSETNLNQLSVSAVSTGKLFPPSSSHKHYELGTHEAERGSSKSTSGGRADGQGQEQRNPDTPGPQASASIRSAVRKQRQTGTKKNISDCITEYARAQMTEQWSRLKRLTVSRTFEWVSGILIICNALLLGMETQWKAERVWNEKQQGLTPDATDSTSAQVLGWLFSMFFLTELVLRWVADGFFDFFKSRDWGWNVLDIIIVCMGLLDQTLSLLTVDLPANVSVVRVLRVVRIVRVARIIRVLRFFRELRIMIFSILGSFKALLWVASVFVIIFYVTGITIMTGVISYWATDVDKDSELAKDLYTHFGGMDKAMRSLYHAMSGGDWSVYYAELDPLGPIYRGLFLTYVTFAIFGVVNIVTGVFVDTALQSNQRDSDIIVNEVLEQKKACLEELAKVFSEMDKDGTGRISQELFAKCLANERVIAYFRAMELDVSNADTLFQLLDYDRSGEIQVGEFLNGCRRLQGFSTALDSAVMQYELTFLKEAVLRLSDTVESCLALKLVTRSSSGMDAAAQMPPSVATTPGPAEPLHRQGRCYSTHSEVLHLADLQKVITTFPPPADQGLLS